MTIPHSKVWSRAARVMLSGALLSLAGCAGGPVKAYPGAERPPAELSVVDCGFAVAIVAIDENRGFSGDPLTCKFALLPGKHAFRVRIVSKQYGTPITLVQQGDQVVEYVLKPGQKYSLNALEDKGAGDWSISIIDPVANKIVPLTRVRLR